MFWNVENLFDTQHDSLKNDYDFLPEAIRKWNPKRYQKKIDDVARVIAAVGEQTIPALVGLCEVENEYVLESLVKYSPLKEQTYQYTMTNSPDERGIDVALLYQRDKFKLLESRSIQITKKEANYRPTRDILHVTGIVPTNDTVDVFVVHFPSKAGGAKESEKFRMQVARKLSNEVDSIIATRYLPQVLIMGDFNDYPNSRSIAEVLEVKPISIKAHPTRLYNLLDNEVESEYSFGSYKYKGRWQLIDLLIVSGNLLDNNSSFYTTEKNAHIARLHFLLTNDPKYGGKQPYRTYNGMKYQGGISDHLPVYTDFILK